MVYICKICNQSFPNKWEYELHFPNALEHKSKKELIEIIAVIQEKNTKLQRVCDCAEAENKALMAYFADKNETTKTMTDLVEAYNLLQQALKERK